MEGDDGTNIFAVAVCYVLRFSCSATLRAPSVAGRGPVPVLAEAVDGLACVPVEWHGLEMVCVPHSLVS